MNYRLNKLESEPQAVQMLKPIVSKAVEPIWDSLKFSKKYNDK